MRLVSLQVEGYRQFRKRARIEFQDGLIGISGPNGAGKSKLIEAMGYALFGPSRKILPDADTRQDLASRAGGGGVQPRVEFTFIVGPHLYRVVRSPSKVEFYVDGDATPQVTTASQVTRYVAGLLRLTPATFRGTFVAHQKDVANLQTMVGSMRKQLIHQLIGVAQVDQAVAFAEEEVVKRREAAARAEPAAGQAPAATAVILQAAADEQARLGLETERLRSRLELASQHHVKCTGDLNGFATLSGADSVCQYAHLSALPTARRQA